MDAKSLYNVDSPLPKKQKLSNKLNKQCFILFCFPETKGKENNYEFKKEEREKS